jgi:hypothetical protein
VAQRPDALKPFLAPARLSKTDRNNLGFFASYEYGHGIAGQFGGSGELSFGNFTPEWDTWNASRGRRESGIRDWIAANQSDRVVVMVVYRYPNRNSRVPSGYRFFAVSASGKLDVQLTAGFTKDGKPFFTEDRLKGLPQPTK